MAMASTVPEFCWPAFGECGPKAYPVASDVKRIRLNEQDFQSRTGSLVCVSSSPEAQDALRLLALRVGASDRRRSSGEVRPAVGVSGELRFAPEAPDHFGDM